MIEYTFNCTEIPLLFANYYNYHNNNIFNWQVIVIATACAFYNDNRQYLIICSQEYHVTSKNVM